MTRQEPPRCPACRCPVRTKPQCTRCGADLTRLLLIQIAAWRARNRARQAILSGSWREAQIQASESLTLHATPDGRRLLAIATLAAGARDALTTP